MTPGWDCSKSPTTTMIITIIRWTIEGTEDNDPIPFDQGNAPIFLPDTHSFALALNAAGLLRNKPIAGGQEEFFKVLSALFAVPDRGPESFLDPPPTAVPWRVPEARSVFLAFSVQANAPPFHFVGHCHAGGSSAQCSPSIVQVTVQRGHFSDSPLQRPFGISRAIC